MVPMMVYSRLTPQSQKQARRVWSLTLLSMVLLGAVATPSVNARPQPSPLFTSQLTSQLKPRQTAQTRLPRLVDQRVRREAAQQLGTAPRRLTVVSYSAETWPDKCLGLAAPNERCMGGETKGWRVEVTDGQQNKVYRTDAKAQTIKLEVQQDQSNLLPEVSERLLQTVAKDAGVPASTLKITETKPATFDGCMGIYKPGQMCTRIAIAGWQVIVAGEKQSWVYHVSEDATRIAQNTTASGSKGEIFISFIPAENEKPISDDQNIVLRQSVSGGIAGITTETFLTSDGVIYQQTSRMGTSTGEPTIVKRISQQQVQQLQQALETQQFPNFRGLRYLTSAAFADYPTTTLQAMGSTVEYIDIEKGDLPAALQAVIQSWEGLQP